jgi:hypothetical protein
MRGAPHSGLASSFLEPVFQSPTKVAAGRPESVISIANTAGIQRGAIALQSRASRLRWRLGPRERADTAIRRSADRRPNSRPRANHPAQHIQLMPQDDIFGLKPRRRIEAGHQTVRGQIQAIDHAASRLPNPSDLATADGELVGASPELHESHAARAVHRSLSPQRYLTIGQGFSHCWKKLRSGLSKG